MVTTHLNPNNKIPVLLLGISIFVAVVMVVWFFQDPTYRPLVYGSALYAFLGVISLGFWTNGAMQDYFFGIEKSYKSFLWIILGGVIGIGILSLSYFGLSMGLPLLPASVGTTFRWITIVIFAPIFEDSLRFALFGFILYLTRRCSKNSCSIDKKYIWIGIFVQAIFFTILHFVAYSQNFYQAPTLLEGIAGLSAVSASLIAAFLFALITGFFCSRDGIKNYSLAIASHLLINLVLFVKLSVVGLSIFPLVLNNLHLLT